MVGRQEGSGVDDVGGGRVEDGWLDGRWELWS
jgi:hypothetical protein